MSDNHSPHNNFPDGFEHYLTIDVEDIVIAASDLYGRPVPAGYENRAHVDLAGTLDVLAETGAHATFFVTTSHVDAHPELLQRIVDDGHRLATHGHIHHDVRSVTVQEFDEDLARSIEILSKHGQTIIGYRPPAFTMPFDDGHLSALKRNGLKYVSCGALFPRTNVPHDRLPRMLESGVAYIPVSMAYLAGNWARFPIGYGHVSRLVPEWLFLGAIRKWVARSHYFHFYFHPYELSGLVPGQRKRLIEVNRGDVSQRIYSRRCSGRAGYFARIFKSCRFEPLETMEAFANGKPMENRIRRV